jgi:hypothetical protein
MEQSKNVQKPKNDGDYYYAVENGFDGALHGNETIDKPEQYAYHNEDFHELDQRHVFDLSGWATPRIRFETLSESPFTDLGFGSRLAKGLQTHARMKMLFGWMWSLCRAVLACHHPALSDLRMKVTNQRP